MVHCAPADEGSHHSMAELTKPDYTALDLPPPPADRPYTLVNMVMSADGKVVIEGNEQGLGSATDRRLMRELRSNADVVVNGANTMTCWRCAPRADSRRMRSRRC